MRRIALTPRLPAALFLSLALFVLAGAQASPSIQFFMPDGSLPNRELRFTLVTDTGRIETYFTDYKGVREKNLSAEQPPDRTSFQSF